MFFVNRTTRYTLATAAITLMVLFCFNQVGDGYGLILPRLFDTLLGSLIAGPVLARAGIAPDARGPVDNLQYGRLWLAIADRIGCEIFGMAARPMRPGSFALMGHAVLHAGRLERALPRALRFLNVVLDDPQHGYTQLLVSSVLQV